MAILVCCLENIATSSPHNRSDMFEANQVSGQMLCSLSRMLPFSQVPVNKNFTNGIEKVALLPVHFLKFRVYLLAECFVLISDYLESLSLTSSFYKKSHYQLFLAISNREHLTSLVDKDRIKV